MTTCHHAMFFNVSRLEEGAESVVGLLGSQIRLLSFFLAIVQEFACLTFTGYGIKRSGIPCFQTHF